MYIYILSMNQRHEQSPGSRTEYVNNIVNELGYKVRLEVALETV